MKWDAGKRHARTVSITGDVSGYTAGGYAYTANQMGFDRIENISAPCKTLVGTTIYELVWDPTGSKIQVWSGTTGATAQVSNATDLSAVTLTFFVIGV